MVSLLTLHRRTLSDGTRCAKLQETSAETYAVTLPSWRLDLEQEIDLIEEIARLHGYNRFANTSAVLCRQRHRVTLGSQGVRTFGERCAPPDIQRRSAALFVPRRRNYICATAEFNCAARQSSQRGGRLSTAIAGSRHAFHAGA